MEVKYIWVDRRRATLLPSGSSVAIVSSKRPAIGSGSDRTSHHHCGTIASACGSSSSGRLGDRGGLGTDSARSSRYDGGGGWSRKRIIVHVVRGCAELLLNRGLLGLHLHEVGVGEGTALCTHRHVAYVHAIHVQSDGGGTRETVDFRLAAVVIYKVSRLLVLQNTVVHVREGVAVDVTDDIALLLAGHLHLSLALVHSPATVVSIGVRSIGIGGKGSVSGLSVSVVRVVEASRVSVSVGVCLSMTAECIVVAVVLAVLVLLGGSVGMSVSVSMGVGVGVGVRVGVGMDVSKASIVLLALIVPSAPASPSIGVVVVSVVRVISVTAPVSTTIASVIAVSVVVVIIVIVVFVVAVLIGGTHASAGTRDSL